MEEKPRSDEGLTLVEVLVYALLLVVVVAVVAGIIISGTKTQTNVSTLNTATTSGQLAAGSLQNGIRNAKAFVLKTYGSDQLVIANTVPSGTSTSPSCYAWYYASSLGTLRYTKLTTALASQPSSATVATWTLLASNVTTNGGPTIFTRSSSTDPTLSIAFATTAGASRPVQFTSSVVSRLAGTDISSCYSGT